MSDFRLVPSDELHLKKEFTAIRKVARFLPDPETSSSWRSPLSSRSVAAASSLNYIHGTRENLSGANHSHRYSEIESCLPFKSDNNQKKVFLYNWRRQSSKSSDSGAKLDGDAYGKGRSVLGSPVDSSSDTHKEGSKSDTYLEDHTVPFRVRETRLETPLRRVKRLKKSSAFTRQRIVRKSAISKPLELASISLGPTTSIEQSDDTDYCNSEDLRTLSQKLTQKNGYTSRSASPLLPGSENWSHSSKLLKNTRRDESSFSCTPASTSSYNIYGNQNPSTVGSWDGMTASFDGDEVDRLDLPRNQGCGIPCYWSKRTSKHRSCNGCYSPSLSDTLKRKGSSILCGSQTLYHKRRSSRSNKQKLVLKSSQGLPLLTNNRNGRGGSSIDTGQSDDELSTNFGELDLEALSRLDGRRWSLSCRSLEGLELVALTGADEGTPDHIRSLSQKYRPRFFDEVIGQNIVIQSLINAISKRRIAPVYLFQGPRGTGKTSTARIFTAALNCMSTEETKPCGSCRECTDFFSGKSTDLKEVDATNKKGIDRVRYLLKSLSKAPPVYVSCYKVFIIDECHLLPSKAWSDFLKFLEEPPAHVVFVFITTDLDSLPRTVLSRCQKYLFNKIKEVDIVNRLNKLSLNENMDVEPHALNLIAWNADGSLRDAETMLDQLSLLGKRITASLVNELVGVVSDEKLLDLLELAMSSDTAETVKRARELMDSGVDPMALMSQLAGLIMDIISGTYHLVDLKCSGSFFGGRSLTEAELERLKQALKLLSEAEKQLRVSSERSTWFTAALLQLGSVPSPDPTHSSSTRKQSSKTAEEDHSGNSMEVSAHKKLEVQKVPWKSTSSSTSMPKPVDGPSSPWGDQLSLVNSFDFEARPACSRFMEGGASATTHKDIVAGGRLFISPERLDDIWERCIDRCHSKTLRQLLRAHGKLVSISEVEGVLIAFIAFEDEDIKSRAERFQSSITNSIETVMKHNVEVRIGLMPDGGPSNNRIKQSSSAPKKMAITEMTEREPNGEFNNSINGHSDPCAKLEPHKVPRESFNGSEGKMPRGSLEQSDHSLVLDGFCKAKTVLPALEEDNHGGQGTKERMQVIPVQRVRAIIDEQRLESAWLQAAEKGTPKSLNRLKPERNQVLPQDNSYRPSQMASTMSGFSSQNGEDQLNREIKALMINSGRGNQKNQSGQSFDCSSMSPSLLHNRSYMGNFNKENLGYESGTGDGGCNGLLCWKTTKRYNKGKIKQGTPVQSHKGRHLSWFGQCGKAKKAESRFKK